LKKKVAILQSNYIPWKGYFELIHNVDLFIFYDDVQYTKRDWRNRNLIKTIHGVKWLTIPVGNVNNRLICDVSINNHQWSLNHWKTIHRYYSRAPYFKIYQKGLEKIYIERRWTNLSELNNYIIKYISRDILKIETVFMDSREFSPQGHKSERLIDILTKAKADCYLSGPSAKTYLDETLFQKANIKVVYQEYSGYPEYPQLYPPFIHEVSILDLLFHVGPKAPYYIWGWRTD